MSSSMRVPFPTGHSISWSTPLPAEWATPIPCLPQAVIDLIPPDGLAADVVTSPERTRFLALAAHRGLKIQLGHEMARAQLMALGRAMGVIGETQSHG